MNYHFKCFECFFVCVHAFVSVLSPLLSLWKTSAMRRIWIWRGSWLPTGRKQNIWKNGQRTLHKSLRIWIFWVRNLWTWTFWVRKRQKIVTWSIHTWYLSFFLHKQTFWRIKFTPKKTRKLRLNTQKIAKFLWYYGKIHSKLPIFCVKSVKIYTGQKKFTREFSWLSWQIWGMQASAMVV